MTPARRSAAGGGCEALSQGAGGSSLLNKLVSARLRALPEVWLLLDRLKLSGTEIFELLREHPGAAVSPHATDTDAACGWLQKNPTKWGPWVAAAQEAAVAAEAARVEASQRKTNVATRARSHCCFVLARIHFMPGLLTHLVPLSLSL